MKHDRVRAAYKAKEKTVDSFLEEKGLSLQSLKIYIRIFKTEGKLEIWGADKDSRQYQLVKTYPICSWSGKVGPKRREGDGQVPEGFYHIDRFNPVSRFHLSLGINYPNASDKILSDKEKPGGDIFIHGECVSIGCLAMTNEPIREIYIIAVEAKNNGQSRIPVSIFPSQMDDLRYKALREGYKSDPGYIGLLDDLYAAYDFFEKRRILPMITFLPDGRHTIGGDY